ncbi:LLM class F420-dependent oxidoreductase [Nocardia sp. CDC160]|uniref:LLM class F420-dependent oxidoreductase n=1 Tax=Nocardia sp. CDC160 TaxID=3112166 RepID=UPI002DBF7A58|nr:LLM class F420-dependent oxidoreductase [Nocardia sp. CDC160]MEC3917716.1 LLM class F420-dependent oxidoreductase [Nocardia sp. CDC160]
MAFDHLGKFGAWQFYTQFTPEAVRELEELGYGAVWLGGSPPADWEGYEQLLAGSESITVATSIVNVWGSKPETAADTWLWLEDKFPGRFLLGIGVGHREHTDVYTKPYDALTNYLDVLDAHGVPQHGRALAALGPRVTKLARDRSAGALPYLTVPEHTAEVRGILGPDPLLAVEHKVALDEDADRARAAGREKAGFYLGLINYVNNLRRFGFDETDLTQPGSDHFVDAVVAHGSAEQIADRLAEHVRAGANHVAPQILGEDYLSALRTLAPLLAERLN